MLGSLGGVYNSQIAPVLNTGGALTGEQARNTDQATRAAFAARGNALGNQALGTELLNRDQYRQNRFNNALTQGLGISGEQRGLTSGIEGLRSQDLSNRLGLTTAQGSLLGSQAALGSGLASGIQGLQGGALNQALGTEQAKVGDAMSIIAPVLGFGQDVFSSNQNAAAAQNIAGANKSSGALGGVLSAVGPILGAAISDKNLKTNIRPTKETTSEGIPIKTFSYRGDKRRFKGVIAQDVEKVRPDAVLTLPVTGHKLVNLAALAGASLEELHRYIPKAAHRG
jgi:hypothetical protein